MKFFVSAVDQTWLSKQRDQVFAQGVDALTYSHIGYFTLWYASVELRLTWFLAVATDIKNLGGFELLTRGMDARVKLERFKIAAKGRIGPNLESRFNILNETMRPLRNRMMHSYPIGGNVPSRVEIRSAGVAV